MAIQAIIQHATISALTMSMIILSQWSNSGVHASASDAEAYFEETIQNALGLMSCEDSKSFIQDHAIFKTVDSSSVGLPNQLNEGLDCQETKSIILDVLAQSVEASRNANGTVHPNPLPPFVCFACVASLCADHGFCLSCCYSGNTVPCYNCP